MDVAIRNINLDAASEEIRPQHPVNEVRTVVLEFAGYVIHLPWHAALLPSSDSDAGENPPACLPQRHMLRGVRETTMLMTASRLLTPKTSTQLGPLPKQGSATVGPSPWVGCGRWPPPGLDRGRHRDIFGECHWWTSPCSIEVCRWCRELSRESVTAEKLTEVEDGVDFVSCTGSLGTFFCDYAGHAWINPEGRHGWHGIVPLDLLPAADPSPTEQPPAAMLLASTDVGASMPRAGASGSHEAVDQEFGDQ